MTAYIGVIFVVDNLTVYSWIEHNRIRPRIGEYQVNYIIWMIKLTSY